MCLVPSPSGGREIGHSAKTWLGVLIPVRCCLFDCMLLNDFRHNTFATGGSDGFVNIWDGFNKKRLCQVQYVFIPCFVQLTAKMLSPLNFTVVKTSLI